MASPTQWNELEQTLGDSEGQETLACCSSWSWKSGPRLSKMNNNKDIYIMKFTKSIEFKNKQQRFDLSIIFVSRSNTLNHHVDSNKHNMRTGFLLG